MLSPAQPSDRSEKGNSLLGCGLGVLSMELVKGVYTARPIMKSDWLWCGLGES